MGASGLKFYLLAVQAVEALTETERALAAAQEVIRQKAWAPKPIELVNQTGDCTSHTASD